MALTQRKLALLEQSLVSHFNQLFRKHAFLDRISIDPATYALTLHRAGRTFTRAHLLAGENQLLAITLLWALRELSGCATPVIIDTPLSRLDSQHRHSMLHDFLPHASRHPGHRPGHRRRDRWCCPQAAGARACACLPHGIRRGHRRHGAHGGGAGGDGAESGAVRGVLVVRAKTTTDLDGNGYYIVLATGRRVLL